MIFRTTLVAAFLVLLSLSCAAQESADSKPVELEVVKASLGVWDAEVEVWANGPEAEPMRFKGVETVRAFGDYWAASDFDSFVMNQTVKVHSIIGYDLDKKQLVGTVVDSGPYPAKMTGVYDKDAKTVHWTTKAKGPTGNPIVQKTSIHQKSADERVLILTVPGSNENEFNKFMQITYKKRKTSK